MVCGQLAPLVWAVLQPAVKGSCVVLRCAVLRGAALQQTCLQALVVHTLQQVLPGGLASHLAHSLLQRLQEGKRGGEEGEWGGYDACALWGW